MKNTIRNTDDNIIIIGAGPAGLGAGLRLKELEHNNFTILEKNPYIGGLSASFLDDNGFTWDIGGHVVFSHYKKFDKIINDALLDKFVEHEREAWIWMKNTFIPYPFQNNIRYLPKDILLECILGLIEAQKNKTDPKDFKEWIYSTFGKTIAEIFMIPYNFKVWAAFAENMDKSWIAERVSIIDVKRILKNLIYDKDDISWGPNNTFRFPLYGGTGEIFRKMAVPIKDHIKLDSEILKIDTEKKQIQTKDKTIHYDKLISTMPLDRFIINSDLTHLQKYASQLQHSSGIIVGIGLKGKPPKKLKTKCWNYFPENNCPFYRVTVFSNYSPNNAPKGCWSLMAETSYSKDKKIDKENIIKNTIDGLKNTRFISDEKIISRWSFDIDYSYPVPSIERNSTLKKIFPELEKRNILSRGRFGAWKYEIANMDHSVMQGIEAAEKLILKKTETTFTY